MGGVLVHKWNEDSLRVNDLALSPDGQRLVVLLESRILVYDFASYEKLAEWAIEDVKLTSVNISKDSQYMLVSMNENKIKLMEIETGEMVQSFSGQVQTQFIIRSAFGGADENFVVSGSEGKYTLPVFHGTSLLRLPADSRIFVWRNNGVLVETLDGHPSGCVNAIAWHPTDPRVFASAGDDKTVRIWRPAPRPSSSDSSAFSR